MWLPIVPWSLTDQLMNRPVSETVGLWAPDTDPNSDRNPANPKPINFPTFEQTNRRYIGNRNRQQKYIVNQA